MVEIKIKLNMRELKHNATKRATCNAKTQTKSARVRIGNVINI